MKQFIVYEVDALVKDNSLNIYARHFTFRIKELDTTQESKKLIELIKSKDFDVIKLLTIEIKRG